MMWPPSRPSARTARSRLTAVPGAWEPSVECLSVSPITSALNSPPARSVTVRHTPLIAIESHRAASAATTGPRTVSRAISPSRSSRTTSPSSSTIPVNTKSSSEPLCLQALRGSRERCADGASAAREGLTAATPVLPPIRTLTVGPGVSPGQPADGFGRVADYHRRFGVSPTPEHAYLRELVCHAGYSAPPGNPRPPGPRHSRRGPGGRYRLPHGRWTLTFLPGPSGRYSAAI